MSIQKLNNKSFLVDYGNVQNVPQQITYLASQSFQIVSASLLDSFANQINFTSGSSVIVHLDSNFDAGFCNTYSMQSNYRHLLILDKTDAATYYVTVGPNNIYDNFNGSMEISGSEHATFEFFRAPEEKYYFTGGPVEVAI